MKKSKSTLKPKWREKEIWKKISFEGENVGIYKKFLK
jgi:hypothetical protein